jgi:hypothetical protein
MLPDRIRSLKAVRETLEKSNSKHAPLFISLLDNGRNGSYHCGVNIRRRFGPNEEDFPGLGKKLSPFDARSLPSPDDLQKLLVDDLLAARENSNDHLFQTATVDTTGDVQMNDEDPDLLLLNNLIETDSHLGSGVLSFPSPSLEELCSDGRVVYEDTVQETVTTATVLQRNTVLPLQHSNEGTTCTTLFSGAVCWIIWPPTDHNISILQNLYEVTAEGFEGTTLDVAGMLEGGVCLVQTVGEAVRIPPSCPIICLSLDTSLIATYSTVTALEFINMLHKLPMLQTWFQSEIGGERKKTEFTAALLEHLSSILQGNFESSDLKKFRYPYLKEGPLHALLHDWEQLKGKVASVLSIADTEHLKVIWEDFLRGVRGRECWICGEIITNKLRLMRTHFETKHWSDGKALEKTEQKSASRGKFRDIIASLGVSEATEGFNADDMMDLVEAEG